MFYKTEGLPEEIINKDFFLLNNFIDNTQVVTKAITIEFQDMCQEVIDSMKYQFSLKDIIEEQFNSLSIAKRDFRIEQALNLKELYRKLAENGLTSDSLYAKLQILDWFWEKCKINFYELRGGLSQNLFNSFLTLLSDVLESILNALGFKVDIFKESLSLLKSLIEMCNTKNQ